MEKKSISINNQSIEGDSPKLKKQPSFCWRYKW